MTRDVAVKKTEKTLNIWIEDQELSVTLLLYAKNLNNFINILQARRTETTKTRRSSQARAGLKNSKIGVTFTMSCWLVSWPLLTI